MSFSPTGFLATAAAATPAAAASALVAPPSAPNTPRKHRGSPATGL